MAQEESLSLLYPVPATQFLELNSSPQGHPGLGLWMGRSFWRSILCLWMVLGAGFKAPCSSSHFTEEEIECDLQCYWVIHRKSELKPTSIYLVALVVKNPPANAGDIRDAGLIPGSGRSPGGGHGNPLQHSCLENPMDRGA